MEADDKGEKRNAFLSRSPSDADFGVCNFRVSKQARNATPIMAIPSLVPCPRTNHGGVDRF